MRAWGPAPGRVPVPVPVPVSAQALALVSALGLDPEQVQVQEPVLVPASALAPEREQVPGPASAQGLELEPERAPEAVAWGQRPRPRRRPPGWWRLQGQGWRGAEEQDESVRAGSCRDLRSRGMGGLHSVYADPKALVAHRTRK